MKQGTVLNEGVEKKVSRRNGALHGSKILCILILTLFNRHNFLVSLVIFCIHDITLHVIAISILLRIQVVKM